MVYLPRHYQNSSQKPPGNKKYFILLFLFFCFVAGFFLLSNESVKGFFVSDPIGSIKEEEQNVVNLLAKGKSARKENLRLQKSILSYLQKDSSNAMAFHFLARSYFYAVVLEGMKFDIAGIVNIYSNPRESIFRRDRRVFKNMRHMYRNALRARAIAPELLDKQSNQLFINLYEIIDGRKKRQIVFEEIKSLIQEQISPQFHKCLLWLEVLSTGLSGNADRLKQLFKENDTVAVQNRLKYTRQEFFYLFAATFFYKKDYLNALNFVRKAKVGEERLLVEALKMESIIFREQNLPQKSMQLLEEIYKKTHGENADAIKLWKQLSNLYPKLKSTVIP
ncbi:MAG: hypothetical protein AAF518_01225 [Spirochaetota bacterium]